MLFGNSISKIDTYLANNSASLAPWVFWGSVIGATGLVIGGARYMARPTVCVGDKPAQTGPEPFAAVGALGVSVGSLILIGMAAMAHKKPPSSFY